MKIQDISNYLYSSWNAIPGETATNKVSHLAIQSLAFSAGIVIYRFVPERFKDWTPYLINLTDHTTIQGITAAYYIFSLHRITQSYSTDKSWGTKILMVSSAYSSLYTLVTIARSILFSTQSKDLKEYTAPPFPCIVPDKIPKTFISALDDCGLTVLEYYQLERKIPFDSKSPYTPKGRVEYFLRQHGVRSEEDLLRKGIIVSRDRSETLKNLDLFFQRKLDSVPSAPLPEISASSRFYARTFNLLLTGSALLINLKFSWRMSIAGFALGYYSKDNSTPYLMKKYHQSAWIEMQYKNRAMFERPFLEPRKEQTALDSPVSWSQRGRQIWEKVHLALLSMSFPEVCIVSSFSYGQTCANYLITSRGDRWKTAPKGTLHELIYGD